MGDAAFKFMDSLKSLSQPCLNKVKARRDSLFIQDQSMYTQKEISECLRDELKQSEDYKDLLLKQQIVKETYEKFPTVIRQMSEGTKNTKQEAMNNIKKDLLEIVSDFEMKCDLELGFKTVFDSFIEKSVDDDEFVPYEDTEEYCIKKELSEKKVIDLEKYNIKLNPKKLKVDNFDCSEIMHYLKSATIESLKLYDDQNGNKNTKNCMYQQLKSSDNYVHQLMRVELIREANTTSYQIEEEKDIFVAKMMKISMRIQGNCFAG